MESIKKQKAIDQTDYWDTRVLDLRILYFGDEVDLIIDNDESTCWEITFLCCSKVLYETDAARRRIVRVRDMNSSQLGYWAQNITVCESKTDGFYIAKLDLSIMEMQIECRDIIVNKIPKLNIK